MRLNDRGIALVKIIFFTAILLAVAAYAARGTRVETRIAHNDFLEKQALQVAEAGLDRAWRKVEQDLYGGSTMTGELGIATSFLGTGSDQTYNGTTYRFVAFPNSGSDGYYVRLVNNSDEAATPTTDVDGKIVIDSVGVVSGSNRRIQALLAQFHAFDEGLFAKYGLSFQGGSTTDSYNSSAGAYGGSNVHNNGDVGTNGSISMNGTPTTVNGDAAATGTITTGSSTITGGQTTGSPQVALPPVTPCNTTMGYTPAGSAGVSAPGNDFSNNSISANSHDNVTLAAGTYCFDTITLRSQATLTVTGPVAIYLTGASDLTGGGLVNNTGLPANLQIYSSCSAAAGCGTGSDGGLKLTGGTNAAFTVYAPDTNIKFNSNPGNIYGAIVGGNVTMAGGASFHYDEALAGTGPLVTALTSWHEVRN